VDLKGKLNLYDCAMLDTLIVTGMSATTGLIKYETSIDDIDIRNCRNLRFVDLRSNLLTTIDLSHNTNLVHINLKNNKINELDVRYQNQLSYLDVSVNDLTFANFRIINKPTSVYT
jgi:hypothetical protein